MSLRAQNGHWLWLSLAIILMDQVSKYFAFHFLYYEKPVALTPFFNLSLNFNPGAAFSFLGTASGWQIYFFSGFSVVVSIVLLVWLLRLTAAEKLKALSLSLIIGGAIGNLIDRIRLGYVIDFFDFHLKSWHFATFNVADSAVSVGAIFLILTLIFQKKTHA